MLQPRKLRQLVAAILQAPIGHHHFAIPAEQVGSPAQQTRLTDLAHEFGIRLGFRRRKRLFVGCHGSERGS